MTANNIGSVIKDLRISRNISAEELSEDVCVIEALLDIERNIGSPTVSELIKFAEKLNVEITYFFKACESARFNHIEGIQSIIRKYIRKRNYEPINDIVQQELAAAKEIPLSFYQFLKWHEAICHFYINKDKEAAIDKLYEALYITMKDGIVLHGREVEILNSISVIHHETKDFESAFLVCEEALQHLDNLPELTDQNLYVRLLHGAAQNLTELNKYKESLVYTQHGIDLCTSNDSMYLLGELFFLAGENLIQLDEKEKGLEFIESSKFIFNLQGNEKFVKLVEREMIRLL
ncbi:helix-turn-helix domain-containing protein [Bacillus sp. V59.32b]|uniref:helix-turn-helix domain-containing protein n=1 Tax=Bacillus sp. V59.32b TaxID=1758642 RepID=UPI000E3CE967|nr:helix-turn-helix domain-containing protein [Bacillus sp. V59.32b]RFU60827.1 XRE family transcriptional regulator [Bacillus sp. V59.32b]